MSTAIFLRSWNPLSSLRSWNPLASLRIWNPLSSMRSWNPLASYRSWTLCPPCEVGTLCPPCEVGTLCPPCVVGTLCPPCVVGTLCPPCVVGTLCPLSFLIFTYSMVITALCLANQRGVGPDGGHRLRDAHLQLWQRLRPGVPQLLLPAPGQGLNLIEPDRSRSNQIVARRSKQVEAGMNRNVFGRS